MLVHGLLDGFGAGYVPALEAHPGCLLIFFALFVVALTLKFAFAALAIAAMATVEAGGMVVGLGFHYPLASLAIIGGVAGLWAIQWILRGD